MREEFEQWYLQVVKGHPNNLLKDERGGYRYLGAMYLAWEAATLIERERCAKACEAERRKEDPDDMDGANENFNIGVETCAKEIRMRSNVVYPSPDQ